MVLKITEASQLKVGNFILIDGEAYNVRSLDISKTGKHGHAKVRMEALSVTSDRKKCVVVPGHERFEVPLIEKRKAQVLSISGNFVSLMDLENFENFDLEIPADLKTSITDGAAIEYWVIEGNKVIKKASGGD
jgi:translation initiation factor 5A